MSRVINSKAMRRLLFEVHILLFFICIFRVNVIMGQDIITPIVRITDVNPNEKSDRVTPVTSTLSRVDAILGENIIFECSGLYLKTDSPMLWKFTSSNGTAATTINDGLKSLDSSKHRISQGTSQVSIRLEIMSVNHDSAGTYVCEVIYDDRSTEIRRSRQVDVYEMPRFEVRDTSFETAASVGDSVRLTCGAVGVPMPRLYWFRSAGSSAVIRNYGRQVEGREIVFSSVQASDRGTYICNAINRIGTSQWPVRLSINFNPMVTFENGASASQKVGCTLELLCVVEANPVPGESAVTVTKDGETLRHDVNGIRLFYMRGADSTVYMSIFIYPFKQSHAGRYTCSARNDMKDGIGSAFIDVTTSNVAIAGRTGTPICSGAGALSSPALLIPTLLLTLLLAVTASRS